MSLRMLRWVGKLCMGPKTVTTEQEKSPLDFVGVIE